MFQFKKFTVQQDRTAMKVCTDACALGAYVSADHLGKQSAGLRILDIGTGTGLLALMAAQNFPVGRIDAVEIDRNAFEQATENVAASPFADRVSVYQTAVQLFEPAYRYDLILSNPPFYTDHLRSPDAATNRAQHTETLSFADLVAAVDRLLLPDGQCWVLLPPYQAGQLSLLARAKNLWPFELLHLRHSVRKAPFRHITGYSREQSPVRERQLIIYEPNPDYPSREHYTPAFRQLLSPFYLIF